MIFNPSFLFLSFCFTNILLFQASPTSSLAPLCHADEKSALLQFKDSFVIDCRASSGDPPTYPKVESWNLDLHHDCCSWNGVTCDDQTGHVVGLDLSSCCLFGSINSTSSLFHLLHLRSLSLAKNDFNSSQIPSDLVHLSELTSLDLSYSNFHGQIPPNFSQLSKLSALDLTLNDELVLKNPGFDRLVENLTSLEDLNLGGVHISSTLPPTLANLSFLKSLSLSDCELYGEFPIGIFQLPHLQILRLKGNFNLHGYLPEFNFSSPLQQLLLLQTNFSGELPDSIGNLSSLNMFNIYFCGFFGQVPASLGNLLELEMLDLRFNNFEVKDSSSLSWISKLNRIIYLGLSGISFNKVFPAFFANLTRLAHLSLIQCEINAQIPSWLMNMTQLVELGLVENQLQGPIPESVFQLRNLEDLNLSMNNLSGTVELGRILNELKRLTDILLSGNNLSLIDNQISNNTVHNQKFSSLGFRACNLDHFPSFLRDQDELQFLDLADNFINGQIPKWVWNTSKETLKMIDLSNNFLEGFEQDPILIPWTQVAVLHLGGNMLQGSLPIPPPSIENFVIDNNNLTGQVSPIICRLNFLKVLDLSDNYFNGTLPPCFDNLSSSIQILNLGGNKFHGKIPHFHTGRCDLRMLSIDSNNLEGEVPRSLSNCSMLEFLILGNNRINDVFPSWLGSLQQLKVLILRSNRFHGGLENHNDFPELLIIDISQNNFSGNLPEQFFLNRNAMMVKADGLAYMKTLMFSDVWINGIMMRAVYPYRMIITNKGIKLRYSKILVSFVAIDFSSNNFQGEIPEVIGNLIGLRLLNLSSNNFGGGIPTSIANLTDLESLDLSRNNLTGEIPEELTKLGFLSVFNVSYNNLTGSIPHGKQFDTFENSSYLRNTGGLCGIPLSKQCGNSEVLPVPPSRVEGSSEYSLFNFGWEPVAIGYGCGLIVGAVIGHILVTKKFEWFLKTCRIRRGRLARITRRRT